MKLKKTLNFLLAIVFVVALSVVFSSCRVLNAVSNSQSSNVSSVAITQDDYKKGILTGTSFESEYLNLKFVAPAGYIMLTQEEMDKMIAFAGEKIFTDEQKTKLDYAKASTVFEMTVQASGGLPNANINVEKTLQNLTIEQYIETFKNQISKLENMQIVLDDKISDATIAGQTYKKITAFTEYNNVSMIQEYYVRKQNNRMINLVVTYSNSTTAQKEALLNSFKPYK